jgi:hypothetical protein
MNNLEENLPQNMIAEVLKSFYYNHQKLSIKNLIDEMLTYLIILTNNNSLQRRFKAF